MSDKKRVYFQMKAPRAGAVVVSGDFNDWEQRSLKPNKKGQWTTWTTLTPGRYEYRYQIDGEWRNDPEAPVVPNEFGSENNVVVVG